MCVRVRVPVVRYSENGCERRGRRPGRGACPLRRPSTHDLLIYEFGESQFTRSRHFVLSTLEGGVPKGLLIDPMKYTSRTSVCTSYRYPSTGSRRLG